MVNGNRWLVIAGLALVCSGYAPALADSGMIIRVLDDRLVYIDLGDRDMVQPDELFEILAAGKARGALRVLQVFDKMALAELLVLDKGLDPMLMDIVPIRDPRRVEQIQAELRRTALGERGPSKMLGVVPGLYQLKSGRSLTGGVLMIAESASLATGLVFRLNSNDLNDRYRRWGNRLFWLAGGLYVGNWIDVLWVRKGKTMSFREQPVLGLVVGIGRDSGGGTMLQVVRQF